MTRIYPAAECSYLTESSIRST